MTETWTFGWFLNLYILEIVTDPNPPPPFPRFDKYWSNNGWDPAWVSLRGTLWWPWRLMGLLFFCLVYAVLIMADLIGCPAVSLTQLSSSFQFHGVICVRKPPVLEISSLRLISHQIFCWIGTPEDTLQKGLKWNG